MDLASGESTQKFELHAYADSVSLTNLKEDTTFQIHVNMSNGVGFSIAKTELTTASLIPTIASFSPSSSDSNSAGVGMIAGIFVAVGLCVLIAFAVYIRSKRSRVIAFAESSNEKASSSASVPFWHITEKRIESVPDHLKLKPRSSKNRYMKSSSMLLDTESHFDPDYHPYHDATSGGVSSHRQRHQNVQNTVDMLFYNETAFPTQPNGLGRHNSLREYTEDAIFHAATFNAHVPEPQDISQSTDGGYLHVSGGSRLPAFDHQEPKFAPTVPGSETARRFAEFEEDTWL